MLCVSIWSMRIRRSAPKDHGGDAILVHDEGLALVRAEMRKPHRLAEAG